MQEKYIYATKIFICNNNILWQQIQISNHTRELSRNSIVFLVDCGPFGGIMANSGFQQTLATATHGKCK